LQQPSSAYRSAIGTKAPSYLVVTNAADPPEFGTGWSMAQLSRCRLKGGDDLFFGAWFRSGHDKKLTVSQAFYSTNKKRIQEECARRTSSISGNTIYYC
jgi:hypothetical protein